jgi:hypothetical protein
MSTRAQDTERISQIQGVLGCALVDGNNGMVLHHAGELPDMVQIGEAAVEFWRLYVRLNAYFSQEFGQLQTQACFFEHRSMALMPWKKIQDAVLVCVGNKGGVDWVALRKLNM